MVIKSNQKISTIPDSKRLILFSIDSNIREDPEENDIFPLHNQVYSNNAPIHL